jgi:hypothetical protein
LFEEKNLSIFLVNRNKGTIINLHYNIQQTLYNAYHASNRHRLLSNKKCVLSMCLCSFCLCEFRKILRKFRTRPIELGVYQAWNIKKAWNIKGIVSRNWGRMQMVLLDRFEVCKIPLNFYFKFKA